MFAFQVSFLLGIPHTYYRNYVESDVNNTGYCDYSSELHETQVGQINLDQFILLYTVIIAYIIPLFTFIFCYSVMISNLSTNKKLVSIAPHRTHRQRELINFPHQAQQLVSQSAN